MTSALSATQCDIRFYCSENRGLSRRRGSSPRRASISIIGPSRGYSRNHALDYAKRLKELADKVSGSLYLVMRVYFEKPRTTVGWKGLINDPMLNDSFEIESGLRIGRELLKEVLSIGLPTATEALDPITPQYLQDLISWSVIGARTTESQTHREMASGLSSSVGFKNGTDGGLEVAINALQSVANPHRFLGINSDGKVSVFETSGNRYGHVVLGGAAMGPTTVRSILPTARRHWSKQIWTLTLWSIAATPTQKKNRRFSPLWRETWFNRLSMAIPRSSV